MVRVTWRSAYSHEPGIAEGGAMDACFLGAVEVGRVQKIGKAGSWICWLPGGPCGIPLPVWREERTWLAARAALSARVAAFLASAGLDSPKQPKAPSGPDFRGLAVQEELPI